MKRWMLTALAVVFVAGCETQEDPYLTEFRQWRVQYEVENGPLTKTQEENMVTYFQLLHQENLGQLDTIKRNEALEAFRQEVRRTEFNKRYN